MKNNIFTVMKKECARIFGDKRLLITTVFLPGVLMYVMYSFMGTFMESMLSVDDGYVYQIHAVNMPDSVAAILSDPELMIEIIPASADEAEEIKEDISNQKTDLLVVFPVGFDETVAAFDPQTVGAPAAPNIEVWSNIARTESGEASGLITGILNSYHHALTHKFTINAPTEDVPDGNFNLATDADMFALIVGMIVPMLFMIFIYTGCQSIAPESIAGEKERGTLGSVLVTPARRSHIALGKILGIAVFAIMSAVVSMLGALLAMPNMMGLESGGIFDYYAVSDFALMLLVVVSTALIFVSILSVLSAYSKSVKEANSYAMPIMLVVFVAGLAGMITGDVPTDTVLYLIPVANSSFCITSIFQYDANALNILVTAATNICVALIFTFILAKIFNSEKIVFDK